MMHTFAVPVIAIFTKFDDLVTQALAALREDGMGLISARRQAPGCATDIFKKKFKIPLSETKYPPAKDVCLQS